MPMLQREVVQKQPSATSPGDSKEPEEEARSGQGGKWEEAASVNHPVKIF